MRSLKRIECIVSIVCVEYVRIVIEEHILTINKQPYLSTKINFRVMILLYFIGYGYDLNYLQPMR